MATPSKKRLFQTITGMHDILPEEWPYWNLIVQKVFDIAHFYGFERIETPILEEERLFVQGVGQATEIVQKQMFAFRTKGGDAVVMRPEGTAPVARAYNQHGMINLPQPVKLWYLGPFFRYEKPQQGRFRQFHQFGFEILGEENPVVDAQLIQIFYVLLKEFGLKNICIELNSMGDSACRPYFKKLLVGYFKGKEAGLCVDCRRRLKENPLRILDCKQERCIQIRSQAPSIIDHLCEECRVHFKNLLEIVEDLTLPYELNPLLVRGLDYYTRTVFEMFVDSSEGRSDAVGGGGRYDVLLKLLGGKDIPASGFAAGIERIIAHMKTEGIEMKKEELPVVFLAQLGVLAKKKVLRILEDFRKAKIPVFESVGRDSLKSQLRIADKLGVRYTIIIGQAEALRSSAIVREMTRGTQETVPLDRLVEDVKKRLKGK